MNIIVLLFLLLISIFWFCVHASILFKNCWDLRFFGGINMLFSSISDGAWLLMLNEDNPMVKRLIISKIVKSSIDLNLSSVLKQSPLLLDWASYSKIPKVAPAGPPPLTLSDPGYWILVIPRGGSWGPTAIFRLFGAFVCPLVSMLTHM